LIFTDCIIKWRCNKIWIQRSKGKHTI